MVRGSQLYFIFLRVKEDVFLTTTKMYSLDLIGIPGKKTYKKEFKRMKNKS